jgi:uncharacterized membrane protein YhfC
MRWWASVNHVVVFTLFFTSSLYLAILQSLCPWFLKISGIIAIMLIQLSLSLWDSHKIEERRKAYEEMTGNSEPIIDEML